MTTPTHAHPTMTRPPDNPQPPPDQVAAAEPELSSNAAADGQPAMAAASLRGTSKVNWAAVGLGLIPAILTAGFVAVMIFAFTGLGDRITSLEARVTSLEARMANLENRVTSLENRVISLENRMIAFENRMIAFERRVEARFAAQDAKIDALDAKIDEINLKLTALINQVDAKLTAQINGIDLKLTALIAALGKTGEVDAAVAGSSSSLGS